MGGLTPQQQAFLAHPPGRSARLIAGPGAGKSYTCVAYMQTHVNPADGIPHRMRMLTFTRAAAAEFAETMERQGLGGAAPAPSTIHAFALGILRMSEWTGIPQPVRIASKWEEERLIRPQLARLLRGQGHENVTPKLVEKLQGEMAAGFDSLDPERVLLADMRPELRNAYQGLWQQHRTRLGYLLLSELPYRAGLAIEDLQVPNLDLDLLLVDEYQDLNRADIKLVHLVAQSGLPVVAIGDEDQSIYGWRHAAPQGIRDFPTDFGVGPEHDYRLTVSRRCGVTILTAAQTLIEQAPGRQRQAAMTPHDPAKLGIIAYLRFRSMAQEATGIAAIVAGRIAEGVPARKIAILARTRSDEWVAALKPAFDARGIAIASSDWVDEALDDDNLVRLRALTQLALNIGDSLSWLTLIKLERGIGEKALDALYRAVHQNEVLAVTIRRVAEQGLEELRPALQARLRALVERTLQDVQAFVAPEGAEVGNWGEWLIERAPPELSENARRLLSLVGDKLSDVNLGVFLAQLEPTGRDFALSEQDAVRFMTIQSSKGLTVDTAILVGVEEGNIPMPRGDIDEERRLLYVGMTRAVEMCVLTFCSQRTGPLARSGRENLGPRVRSTLLEGVLNVQEASTWLEARNFV